MKLQLITPERILFSGDIAMATAPGTEGEFGVLPEHAPFVSTLKPGVIFIELAGGEKKRVAVLSGVAEVVPERMTILAEIAEDCTSITGAEAQSRLQAARLAFEEAISESQKKDAGQKLALAETVVRTFAA